MKAVNFLAATPLAVSSVDLRSLKSLLRRVLGRLCRQGRELCNPAVHFQRAYLNLSVPACRRRRDSPYFGSGSTGYYLCFFACMRLWTKRLQGFEHPVWQKG